MRIRDVVRRAGRSLGQAKARTLLTSLAIGVGAFTITVALAAGAGGHAYTDSLLKNNGDSHNLGVFAKVDESQSDTPKEYGTNDSAHVQGVLTKQDIETIQAVPGVETVNPAYNVSATYMTREGQKKYQTSLTIKVDRTVLTLAAGSLKNNKVQNGTIVVPETYMSVLGFQTPSDAIGKTIMLHIERPSLIPGHPATGSEDVPFTIAAVDKKSSTVLQYQAALRISPGDGKAIYDFQTKDIPNNDTYLSASVRVSDNADVATVQKAIKDKGYSVFSQQDIQQVLFTFINVIQYGAAGFGALAILASIFGIINTQYISVLERTQQIGLMKALGARRKDIGRLFRYEAAWVGFLGGAIGTGLALLTALLNPWIASSLSLEKGTELLIFSPVTSVVLIAGLMVVAVMAGYFPARKAAKLDPIEALRTE